MNQRTQSRIFVRSSRGKSTSAITELPMALYSSAIQFVSIDIPSRKRTTKKYVALPTSDRTNVMISRIAWFSTLTRIPIEAAR